MILCSWEIKFALAVHPQFIVKGHEYSTSVPLRIGYDVQILCNISSVKYQSHCRMMMVIMYIYCVIVTVKNQNLEQ